MSMNANFETFIAKSKKHSKTIRIFAAIKHE